MFTNYRRRRNKPYGCAVAWKYLPKMASQRLDPRIERAILDAHRASNESTGFEKARMADRWLTLFRKALKQATSSTTLSALQELPIPGSRLESALTRKLKIFRDCERKAFGDSLA